jgi:tetratricopeptide (TPR) repeat protein
MPLRALCAAALCTLMACASTPPAPLYQPAAHRALLTELLPEVAASDLVVPFEVDDELVERAENIVKFAGSEKLRTLALVEALGRESRGFGLTYMWARNNSARDAARAGGGTCMGLSSLLVGILRSLGTKAYYVEALTDPETRIEATVTVAAGHIAVEAVTDSGSIHVDFTGEIVRPGRYRRISDRQATAHYYNNRGYELIHDAEEAGAPLDWARVLEQFELATRIDPDLAISWNNLGVASARLGDRTRAEASYARAITLDPSLRSPQANLVHLDDTARYGTRGEGGTAPELIAPGPRPRPLERTAPRALSPRTQAPAGLVTGTPEEASASAEVPSAEAAESSALTPAPASPSEPLTSEQEAAPTGAPAVPGPRDAP